MPHKNNADHRHHIPKMAFKVQNWPVYEAGLRRRGSLTLWIEDAALGDWQTTGPGGQARYMDVTKAGKSRFMHPGQVAAQGEPGAPPRVEVLYQ